MTELHATGIMTASTKAAAEKERMQVPTVQSSPSPQAAPACRSKRPVQEYRELKKLISWVLLSLLMMTALTIFTGIITDSLAIDAVAFDAGASLVLHLFNLICVGVILRQNSFNYPYGTGKLENFSGFLYAVILLPGAGIIIYSAVKRYLHPPTTIDFVLAQILLAGWILRDIVLYLWSARICKRHPAYSPMTHSYLINMKISLIYCVALLAGLAAGFWLFSTGRAGIAVSVDLLIAVAVATYMAYCAMALLVRNFRSLIDLPLPESDQLKILHALAAEFDHYAEIGNIYSQLSGSTRLIQIELYVNGDVTAQAIEQLRDRLEKRLQGQFSTLMFHLIPLVRTTAGDR